MDRIPLWLATLHQELAWRIVYADELWALLLRPGFRPDLPPAPLAEPVEGRDYPAFTRAAVREMLAAEHAKGPGGITAWWRGRDALPLRALRLSSFYLRTGKPHAAAAIGLEAMRESPSRVPGLG